MRLESVAEDQLTGAIRHLFAMAVEHPQLRASGEFKALERTLEAVEESQRNARRDYNATVLDYNRRIQSFPGNLLAGLLGLQPKPFFELASAEKSQTTAANFRRIA